MPTNFLRLKDLHRTGILDSGREAGFDRIAKAVALVCGTPVGFISLIDANRQWFKASHGIDLTETSLEMAFCTSTIQRSEPLIIEDCSADPFFRQHPLVRGPQNVRFYAGAPLIGAAGYAFGGLCVADFKPHKLTEGQIEVLKALAVETADMISKYDAEIQARDKAAALSLIDHLGDGVLVVSRQGEVRFANPSFGTIFGLKSGVMAARPFAKFEQVIEHLAHSYGKDSEKYLELLPVSLSGAGQMVWQTVVNNKDWLVEFKAIPDQASNLVTFCFRKTRRDELHDLGEMAASMIHEINGSMTIISETARQLDEVSTLDDSLKVKVKRVKKFSTSTVQMMKAMRELYVAQPTCGLPVDINEIVEQALQFCADDIKKEKVSIKLELIKNEFDLLGHPVQLMQIFINMFKNSMQAMRGTQNKEITVRTGVENGKLKVSVSDSGPGVTQEVRRRLFEFFNSDKASGEGTGIGLALSQKIVREHGGAIHLSDDATHPNAACFVIELPLATIEREVRAQA